MNRGVFLCGTLLLLMVTAGQAAVTDAPHNDSYGISCTSCHSYSFWWQYSPAQKASGFASLVDTMCLDCHDANGSGPNVLTHSSATIGSVSHGTWERACTACHNPHNQDQLAWAGTATTPYLITGTITAVSYDSGSKQTTLTYAEASSNAKWPAVGATAADLDWANKSLTNPGRGLILAHDMVATSGTYTIVAASATDITIKGEITADMIDPNYTNPATQQKNTLTCNTFGLIYGDLIRNTINSRPVKFFDPNGGFVRDEGTNPSGLCQVCHTETAHYTNNGTMPSGDDTHLDRDGMNCITCHPHLNGFRGEGHDGSSFVWADNCAICHNPTGGAMNITNVVHGRKCGLCHVSPAGGGPRMDGNPSNGIDGSAVVGTNDSTCVDCHLTTLSLTKSGIHHVSAHNYAADGNCTQCHDNAVGKLAADHSAVVTNDNACILCHAATAGTAGGIAVSSSDNKLHDACTTCHNNDGTLKAAYGKAIAIPAHGGSCTDCHGDYFTSHQNIDHSARVAGTTNCTTCHLNTPGTATTVPVDPADNKVHDACGTCHDATGALRTAYGKAMTMPAGGGDCNACHGAYFANHSNANHTTRVAASDNCILCHAATAGTATTVPVNPADNKLHDACGTCHNTTTGTLLPAYGKALAIPAAGGDCEVCHGAYFANHAAANHATRVAGATSCISCHTATAGTATGMPVNSNDSKIHDACTTCHEINGSLKAPYGKAIAMPVNGGNCTACHGVYFLDHVNAATHSGQVDKAVPNCTSACHFHDKADPVVDIHNNTCSHCHNMTPNADGSFGETISLAAEFGPGDCTHCHWQVAADPTVFHPRATDHVGQVDREPTCTDVMGCHPGANVNQVHPLMCVTCHEPIYFGIKMNLQQYNITKAIAVTPGNCTACHSQTATDGHEIDPTNCAACHPVPHTPVP